MNINMIKLIIILSVFSKTCAVCTFNKKDAEYSNVISYEDRTYKDNEKLNYECAYGFNSVFVICNNGSWSTKNMCIGKRNCKDPVMILNGNIKNKQDKYSLGDSVTYMCKVNKLERYSLVGNETVKCIDGKWVPDNPFCKLIRCKYPALQNGILEGSFKKKFYYGDVVIFKCKTGFRLSGSLTSTCGINFVWVPNLPKCVKDSVVHDEVRSDYLFKYLNDSNNDYDTNYYMQNIVAVIFLVIICFIFVLGLSILSCSFASTSKPSYDKL
ncbi:144R [Yaba monkey tumor virus]|uniref:Complement control protein C3 n=1 Tax=Yaba monkey tumor virus (strain VR587) TaxID=928314 RepID=Q6TUN0_YMTV5|nr:EEV host range protein [Yaba monkey tumor virus]AAR07496.1 144R [Yaba monkey tumor virus]